MIDKIGILLPLKKIKLLKHEMQELGTLEKIEKEVED
jgi:hypothetical protein